MNHREERVTNRIRKKNTKAIRSGQYQSAALADQPTIRNTRGQAIAKPPKKILARLQGNLKGMERSIAHKKLARAEPTKHSKRTTPGEIPKNSTPKYPHMEGGRWAKITTKQSLLKSKLLKVKLNKRK